MIEINIGALVVLLGIPTAVTGFCFISPLRIRKPHGPRACP